MSSDRLAACVSAVRMASFRYFTMIGLICIAICASVRATAEPPMVGAVAPDFTLRTPQGMPVRLSKWAHGRTLALVVLRGFPGYQCPYCQKQVHDFVNRAGDFAAKNAAVLLVYPGATSQLDQRASEFLATQDKLPKNVILVTDPDLKVTELYGLRWNEPGETSYPSTFILRPDLHVVFVKISKSHGDRLSAQEALDQLPSK